ncbi:type IV secretion system protein VirB10 [Ensifer sp. T173]|jgi:type IV secretion system protein VirB10|uniref:Type IV secretion system protein VirB10 n=1 Tax=Ensifer canadensis TaxID=555315 RepID=A0AAW4FR10_9HYPH|nr:type IV secretion system protein VirB10 [Ensifer canadensis]MBM3093770.1 type IV secretion system protein VirB10 [Ensifer canadensis]UBI77695.1 type IV secretion system protein VirB10 [Ensifer canadensis]
MTDDVPTTIPGERGHAQLPQGFDNNPALRRGAVVAAILAFIGFGLWSMRSQTLDPNANREERVVIRQATDFEPAKEEPKTVEPLPEVKLPTPVVAEAPTEPEKDELLESARRAPVMAFNAGQGIDRRSESTQTPPDQASTYLPINGALGGEVGENEDQRFDRMLKPTRLEGSRAGHLGNRNYIVAMGTSIPCVLETALSSDQPGFASCVINRDVFSDNGRVVLMEKGTQVVGEYRGGLRRGQKRLFVLWNRAKTPTGVIIALASPATDALGRAGFDGHVDSHWWERFGSALLLSIVGDVASFGGRKLQDQEVDVEGTTSAGRQAAAIAVEQSINVVPTLNKHQGELVSIFVARDLDFSGIYELRVSEPRSTVLERSVLGDFSKRARVVTK